MDCPLHWRHTSTCCRVICAYCAYVTIPHTLGDTCCATHHFVNKVIVRHFSAENKQELAEFYSQHLPMHSCDVIWKIKSKSTFPVSFSMVGAEMNLAGNYQTLRGLRTINPEGLPSTTPVEATMCQQIAKPCQVDKSFRWDSKPRRLCLKLTQGQVKDPMAL